MMTHEESKAVYDRGPEAVIAFLVQGMTEGVQEVERRWETFLREGHKLEITTEMTRLTLQIVGRALLSTDVSQRNDQLRRNLLTCS